MNILLHSSFWHPNSLEKYFRRALIKAGHSVHSITPSSNMENMGVKEFFNIFQAVDRYCHRVDLLIYLETSGCPYFPIGIEKLPFPTVFVTVDYLAKPQDTINQSLFPLFDFIFCMLSGSVEKIKRFNSHAYFLPVGVPDDVYDLETERDYDVGQVGGMNHPYRIRIANKIQALYNTNDMDLFYPHEDVRVIYSRSKISVNASNNEMNLLNMRMWEVMACGALLITGPTDPVFDEMFTDGIHFVRYINDKDLFEKIEYYLSNDDERERIAMAGQREVLEKHSFESRIQQILSTVAAENGLIAPARKQPSEWVAKLYMEAYKRRSQVDSVYRTAIHYLPVGKRWLAAPFWLGAALRQMKTLSGFGSPFELP